MKAFWYKDQLYIRLIPSKRLFNSTMVHEVVNRGDVFAMNMTNQQFTIIPGTAQVEHQEIPVNFAVTREPVQLNLNMEL